MMTPYQKKCAHVMTICLHFIIAMLTIHFTNKKKNSHVLTVNYIFIGITVLSLYPILRNKFTCEKVL